MLKLPDSTLANIFRVVKRKEKMVTCLSWQHPSNPTMDKNLTNQKLDESHQTERCTLRPSYGQKKEGLHALNSIFLKKNSHKTVLTTTPWQNIHDSNCTLNILDLTQNFHPQIQSPHMHRWQQNSKRRCPQRQSHNYTTHRHCVHCSPTQQSKNGYSNAHVHNHRTNTKLRPNILCIIWAPNQSPTRIVPSPSYTLQLLMVEDINFQSPKVQEEPRVSK